MRLLVGALSVIVFAVAGASARADDGPAPVTVPPALVTPADNAPTADQRSRAVEQMPMNAAPVAPAYAFAAYPVAACAECRQRRDECGWALDSCGNRIGRWELTLAGQFSGMGSPDGILGEDLFIPGNHLRWNGVDYKSQLGGRLGISYHVEPQSRVELIGVYYGKPDGSNAQNGQFAARPGVTGLGDISRVVDAAFRSQAEAWGLELNWWTELTCKGAWRVDAGIGARYLSFDETAHVDFVTSPAFVGPFPVANGFVDSFAQNRFYGGQLGLAAHYDADCRWELGASLKALFGSIDRNLTVSDDSIFAGGRHSSREGNDEFVFGMNLDLTATWHVTPRVSVLAGYDLLFLDNVQRAEDGMSFAQSNSGAVQARQSPGQLVIHSIFLGVAFTF